MKLVLISSPSTPKSLLCSPWLLKREGPSSPCRSCPTHPDMELVLCSGLIPSSREFLCELLFSLSSKGLEKNPCELQRHRLHTQPRVAQVHPQKATTAPGSSHSPP